MERVNYHTHCHLCGHATGEAVDYAREAIRHNFTRIGFSDHLPFPDAEYPARMKFEEIDIYRQQLDAARAILPDTITMLSGFEGEYIPGQEAYYEAVLTKMGFDYLVLGQHIIIDKERNAQLISHTQDTKVYLDYAQNILDGMQTGYFALVAHPDIIFMNDLSWDCNCEKACDMIIDAASKYDYILEYNANGIRKGITDFQDGRRRQYPYNRFWEMVASTNIRVMVGSDCHAPEHLYDECMILALKEAQEYGLHLVDII